MSRDILSCRINRPLSKNNISFVCVRTELGLLWNNNFINFTNVSLGRGYMVCFSRHGDVIKWKRFPRYWPFVRGIHRWPVNSPPKGQRREAFMFSLICVFDNKRLSKQLRRRRFETPSRSLWRQCNRISLRNHHKPKPRSSITSVSIDQSFKKMYRTQICHCRALSKILKRSSNWAITYKQMRFRECWVWDDFLMDILFRTSPRVSKQKSTKPLVKIN